jgi:phosphoribosylglycinamide formyltransferase 2
VDAAYGVDPSVQVRLFAKPRVDGERRIGVTLARGANADEARARARSAAELMKVRLEG